MGLFVGMSLGAPAYEAVIAKAAERRFTLLDCPRDLACAGENVIAEYVIQSLDDRCGKRAGELSG